MGIDHVGIGTDKAGPGPGTDSMIEWPSDMPDDTLSPVLPGSFNYSGFRIEEHRLGDEYHIVGYNDFRDWPNLTVALADRGFNEEEPAQAPRTQLPAGVQRRRGVRPARTGGLSQGL